MKPMYYILGGLAVILSVCFLMAGCGEKENIEQIINDKVSVDKTELTFTGKDESKTFSLFCMDEWHLEAEGLSAYYGPNMADVKDFTVEPVSGKGNIKITVTLKNELTESYVVDLKAVGKSNQAVIKLNAVVN